MFPPFLSLEIMEDKNLDSLYLTFILFLMFISVWVIITYRIGDWRNWRLYYPTILFFWCGNLIGFLIFNDNLLWEYNSNVLSHAAVDIIQMTFIFTSTTILFLQYYPKTLLRQVFHILLWVFIFTGVEFLFHLFGVIQYYNGWSIWWSAFHNVYQFILLRIHFKRPILAWILSFTILGIILVIFM
jgi:hypothetical protein